MGIYSEREKNHREMRRIKIEIVFNGENVIFIHVLEIIQIALIQ